MFSLLFSDVLDFVAPKNQSLFDEMTIAIFNRELSLCKVIFDKFTEDEVIKHGVDIILMTSKSEELYDFMVYLIKDVECLDLTKPNPRTHEKILHASCRLKNFTLLKLLLEEYGNDLLDEIDDVGPLAWDEESLGLLRIYEQNQINEQLSSPQPLISTPERNCEWEDGKEEEGFFTPTKGAGKRGGVGDEDGLREKVVEAAIKTTEAFQSPPNTWHRHSKLFQLCSSKCLSEGQQRIMREMIENYPSLLSIRASQMLKAAQDGHTPLHTCCKAGNHQALSLLLPLATARHLTEVDLQGRTPLHLGAECGSGEVVEGLRRRMEELDLEWPVGILAPLDLAGNTPLCLATSSKSNHKKVHNLLFREGDRSIFPITPSKQRSKSSLNLDFAFSTASGWRPYMEDRLDGGGCYKCHIPILSKSKYFLGWWWPPLYPLCCLIFTSLLCLTDMGGSLALNFYVRGFPPS